LWSFGLFFIGAKASLEKHRKIKRDYLKSIERWSES